MKTLRINVTSPEGPRPFSSVGNGQIRLFLNNVLCLSSIVTTLPTPSSDLPSCSGHFTGSRELESRYDKDYCVYKRFTSAARWNKELRRVWV